MVFNNSSSSNYLDTDSHYWTMSPFWYSSGNAQEFYVHSSGRLSAGYVNNTLGIRPVINLRSDVTFTGDGTISNPFKVS